MPVLTVFPHLAIAFVTPNIKLPIGHRPFDRTILLMRMRAIRKVTAVDKWPQVSKVATNFFWNYIPQLKLPNAGRVD